MLAHAERLLLPDATVKREGCTYHWDWVPRDRWQELFTPDAPYSFGAVL
jgi:hypothetical protein